MAPRRAGKGSFTGAKLPLASEYVYPGSRNRLILAGLLVALLVAGGLLVDFLWGGSGVLSSGPLSSAHAGVESYCANCHTRFFRGVSGADPAKCAACHEPAGDDLGVHTFDAHYVYRSGDAGRAFRRDHETACAACHPEHRGRAAMITAVADSQCAACHGFASFETGHPEFAFLASGRPDAEGLAFGHIRHVKEVRDRQGLDDVEASCLYCHNSRPGGRGFEPIDFDLHCAGCHLGAGVRSANLPIRALGEPLVAARNGGVEVTPAVETLEAIRARNGPGEQWAASVFPGDFRVSGRRVMKIRIEHRDPWITHNLGQIRAALYPTDELAALLEASPEVADDEIGVLYEESIVTLRQRASGLHGEPEEWVQQELEQMDRLLALVERRVADPNTALDAARFELLRRDPRLSGEQVDELVDLADQLTTPCRQCHRIDNAAIARVQPDQRELRRAEFDHRAHVLQRRCLDCHGRIPILDYLADPSSATAEIDNAAIHNLPGIETCRQCHGRSRVSEACITCHDFHPRGGDRTPLQLYVR